jgi:hypothetical protein
MYGLPCRHYFVVARRFGLTLVQKSLYADRWHVRKSGPEVPLESFTLHVPTSVSTVLPTTQYERQRDVDIALRNLGETAGIY